MQFLVNMIIRPPRAQYPIDKDKTKKIGDSTFAKKVFTLTNAKGEKLSCMFWEPVERPSEKMPVVIYMHGNAGCKLEAEEYAETLLPQGINLFAFDFSGCGNSEGDWVTLGWKEKRDLETVINYLVGLGTVSKIGLWGRSMGAATAIMYTAENPDKVVSGLILDSGFSTFLEIANQLAT